MHTRLRWLLLGIGLVLAGLLLFQHQADRELKARLLRYLSSRSDQRTAEALNMLRSRGWQTDAALQGLDLSLANFEGNDLSGFDFSGANFYNASLFQATARGIVRRDATL